VWIENDQSPSSNLKLQDIQAKNHHQANPVVVRSLAEHSAQVLEQPGRSVWNIYDARIHDAALFFEDYRQAHAAWPSSQHTRCANWPCIWTRAAIARALVCHSGHGGTPKAARKSTPMAVF